MAEDRPARFVDEDVRGARFERSTLAGATIRGGDVDGLEIDAPWLADGGSTVNGVDVVPLVEAELNRRFPGRDHEPVRHALHVILNEEWEHLRFARRDLDTQAG